MSDSPPPQEPETSVSPLLNIDKDSDTGSAQMSPSAVFSCEMCQNYETNLTILQDNERKLKEELKAVKSLSDRYEGELATEREYRRDLEKKMSEVCAQAEDRIQEITAGNTKVEEAFAKLTDRYSRMKRKNLEALEKMKEASEFVERELQRMSEKYLKLLGTNRARASEMREEAIDFPEDQEALQLQCLMLREQLIECKAAKEHLETELRDECTMLRTQLHEDRNVKDLMERDLMGQINQLNTELGIVNSQLSSAGASIAASDEHKRRITELQHTVGELESQVQQVQDQRKAVEQTAQNYKARCTSLQKELDNSEAVQKDFVRLSQSLQIQLEKIRQSEQEVRFQFEDDVDNCGECNTVLVKGKKPHCRHCGKIFCAKCLELSVPAGPNHRPANVCRVCHTLLKPDSAPFFSQEK